MIIKNNTQYFPVFIIACRFLENSSSVLIFVRLEPVCLASQVSNLSVVIEVELVVIQDIALHSPFWNNHCAKKLAARNNYFVHFLLNHVTSLFVGWVIRFQNWQDNFSIPFQKKGKEEKQNNHPVIIAVHPMPIILMQLLNLSNREELELRIFKNNPEYNC